ncbi:MAG TPA: hypothetical protein VMV69_19190, partial [Pirellulales bacterium]|nr:hypothetical protein [Pirellulales bacterium]
MPVFSEAALEGVHVNGPRRALNRGGPWTGSASDLLYAVETIVGRSGARHGGWPRDITRFGGC